MLNNTLLQQQYKEIVLNPKNTSVLHDFFAIQQHRFVKKTAIAAAISYIIRKELPNLNNEINQLYENEKEPQYTQKLIELNDKKQKIQSELYKTFSHAKSQELQETDLIYNFKCAQPIIQYFEDTIENVEEILTKYNSNSHSKTST